MTDNIVLQCPECKKPVHWNDKYPHRPFCSARCKQIDFGDWANETHRIAGQALHGNEDDLDNSLDGSYIDTEGTDTDGELDQY